MTPNKKFIVQKLLDEAKDAVANMTPEQYAEMMENQKASFVRGMTVKCEHGVLDFEQCPECRRKYRATNKGRRS